MSEYTYEDVEGEEPQTLGFGALGCWVKSLRMNGMVVDMCGKICLNTENSWDASIDPILFEKGL